METERPDDATGDSVILARVHTFLAALLSFLGFGHLPDTTIAGMLDELTGWLEMAKSIRRDPQGATARIWWDAFKMAWADDESETAGRCADLAAHEFGKRFLPVNAEDDRDTLNTADFDALREELDKQTQIAAELRSERDALLKTNTHHASELKHIRADHESFVDRVRAALGVGEGVDTIAVIKARTKQHREYHDLRAKLARVIVPLPKPARIELGQQWARISTITDVRGQDSDIQLVSFGHGVTANSDCMRDDSEPQWLYLGTEAK